jgi:hypothetical protein
MNIPMQTHTQFAKPPPGLTVAQMTTRKVIVSCRDSPLVMGDLRDKLIEMALKGNRVDLTVKWMQREFFIEGEPAYVGLMKDAAISCGAQAGMDIGPKS